MEPWESGLIYLFAKEAGGKTPRGFESLRLRNELREGLNDLRVAHHCARAGDEKGAG